jgi:hypothetical protein
MEQIARTAACLMLALSACTDSAKVSEQNAALHADRLAKLADDDVEQVRHGVPRGAKELATLWETKAPTMADHGPVYRRMEEVRNNDRDLRVAKSTFFAVTDAKGDVLSSDQDPDSLQGKNLVLAYPALSKARDGELVETTGAMPETAVKPGAPDEQWLVAAPVRDGAGAVRGIFASGWSMIRFTYHLEETLKHDFVTQAIREKRNQYKQPLVYAFVFVGKKVYGAPVTPIVNVRVLEALDLPARTAAGPHQQVIEITGRRFGLGARRAPKLGPDAGVAVLRSET